MYQPFPIQNMSRGKITARQPWLLPQDAFEEMTNCYVKRGVLFKRQGYQLYDRISRLACELIGTGNGSTKAYSATLKAGATVYPLRAGSVVITDGTETFSDDGAGTLTGDAAGTGTINYTTGAVAVSFHANVGNGTRITATYDYYMQDPIMGIYQHVVGSTKTLLVSDYTRTAEYTSGEFEDLKRWTLAYTSGGTYEVTAGDVVYGQTSGAMGVVAAVSLASGTWAGGDAAGNLTLSGVVGTFQAELLDVNANSNVANASGAATTVVDWTLDADHITNFFDHCNWLDKIYITNNYDQIKYYDGSALTLFVPNIGGAGAAYVNACKMIFVFKERLLLLYTTEGSNGKGLGTEYPQRARWSSVNDPTAASAWATADYLDCPTSENIMGAEFQGNDLIVFFERSTWRLAYTADSDLPFRWERIPGEQGCVAQKSVIAFADHVEAMGFTTLIKCDNVQVLSMEQQIPEYLLEQNVSSVEYAFGTVVEEERQSWMSMISMDADTPDHVLVHNYEEDTWSKYTMTPHCFGNYDIDASDAPTWDGLCAYLGLDTDSISDDIDYAFNDRRVQAGYPITLMGDRSGYVWHVNLGNSDNGSSIEFEAIMGEWNPYIDQGYKDDLGWIDFLCTAHASHSFSVSFYKDQEATAYQTSTITLDGGDSEYVRKRIYVGCIAEFHQIKIHHDETDMPIQIHAIIPYFQRGAPLI